MAVSVIPDLFRVDPEEVRRCGSQVYFLMNPDYWMQNRQGFKRPYFAS